MALTKVVTAAELPAGTKKAIKAGETEILLVHTQEGSLYAVEAKCPHAGGPLEEGAVCNGRLICPWHMGTFELETGAVVEPPPLRSLRHYTVQRDGDSISVDPVALNTPSPANYNDNVPAAVTGANRHIVTIGSGASATAAVCALRQGGFGGRISMLDPVTTEPTDRTNLSKMALAGKKPLDTLPLWSADDKTKLNVERVQASVATLDGEAGMLTTEGGQTIRFDAALLAVGGVPSKLGIPGEDLPHVHSIRHVANLEAIGGVIGNEPKGKQVVLIGDSFIAFEAASALTTRGLQATLVCRSPQPFSQKFGEVPAQAILALHQANGVTLKLGAEARAITSEAVTLKSGESLPADLVIVAVGVKPTTAFEHGLQLEKDGGVSVREDLKAASRVWVAGDIAAVNGMRIEHWRLAQQHGRTAAAAMLGELGAQIMPENELLHNVPFFWTAHFGKRFGYVGHAENWDDIQVDGSLGENNFLVYYCKGNAVQAVLACGKDGATAMLAESMRETLTLEQARGVAARV